MSAQLTNLRVRCLTYLGVNRHQVVDRDDDYWKAKDHFQRAVRKGGTQPNRSKIKCASIEDLWNTDPALENRLKGDGCSLNDIRAWDKIGPHIGEDQEQVNMLLQVRHSTRL